MSGLMPVISHSRITFDSRQYSLPTVGFLAGGLYQSNSLTQAPRSSALILCSCLAALLCFFLCQGGFVCFKHSRRFIVVILMSYICKISVRIHSFSFTCLDTTQVKNWILAHSRLPLQVSALSWVQPGRKTHYWNMWQRNIVQRADNAVKSPQSVTSLLLFFLPFFFLSSCLPYSWGVMTTLLSCWPWP